MAQKKTTTPAAVQEATANKFHMRMSTTNGAGISRTGTIDEVAGRYLVTLSRGVESRKGPGINISVRGPAEQDVMRDTMAEAMDLVCRFTLSKIDLPVPR
jgi:hypothetical protein